MLRLLPILPILIFPAAASAAPADLDAGFGTGGRAIVDFGGDDDTTAVAIQPDGKVVVGGYTEVGEDGVVWRLNGDGTPDRGFGADGAAVVAGGGLQEWRGWPFRATARSWSPASAPPRTRTRS